MIKSYLFSVVACALMVSMAQSIPQKKSIGRIVSLLGGVILLLALLRPLLRLRLGDPAAWLERYSSNNSVISSAIEEGENESARLISEQTRQYILDKASALDLDLEVSVELAALSEHYRYPYRVTLRGSWQPEQKAQLSTYIAQTLGIPEERQLWISA